MALLDKLSTVDWSDYRHAYGSAKEVPELLRALVDPEAAPESIKASALKAKHSIREEVEDELWQNIFHQGNVYDVTPKAVPFLVEILRDGPQDPSLQEFVLMYLHHLAIGYPTDTFPELPSYDTMRGAGLRTYAAVRDAVPDIFHFIWSVHENVALEAIGLLASFPDHASLTAPVLRELLQSSSGQRAGHTLISLAQLEGPEACETAMAMLKSGERAVSIQAACAALLADPERASDTCVDMLTQPLGELGEEYSVHADTLTKLVGVCLRKAPAKHSLKVVHGLAAQLRDASPMEGLSLANSMLLLAFEGNPAPESASLLTPLQRLAVEAIHDHGPFLIGNGQFMNFENLLRGWGLPVPKAELTAWLE